jgi:hypothetical protein
MKEKFSQVIIGIPAVNFRRKIQPDKRALVLSLTGNHGNEAFHAFK